MSHETSICLPARLMGIVRTDGPAPVPAPLMSALAPVPVAPTAALVVPAHAAERERLQQAVQALHDAAAALGAESRQLALALEPLAVELALAVAGRFLQSQVTAGDFPLRGLIRQAVERLESRHPVQILLHNEDLATIRQQLAEDPATLGSAEVRLKADPTLPRGSFRIQTHDRSMNFDLESRLTALRQTLLDVVANEDELGISGGKAGQK